MEGFLADVATGEEVVAKWVNRVQFAERAGLANYGGEAREGEPELPLEEGLESVVG